MSSCKSRRTKIVPPPSTQLDQSETLQCGNHIDAYILLAVMAHWLKVWSWQTGYRLYCIIIITHLLYFLGTVMISCSSTCMLLMHSNGLTLLLAEWTAEKRVRSVAEFAFCNYPVAFIPRSKTIRRRPVHQPDAELHQTLVVHQIQQTYIWCPVLVVVVECQQGIAASSCVASSER